MAHKNRKVHKSRGSRHCGFGNTQRHRGAGSRGGRGNAGSKKQKWSYTSKYLPGYFGRRGFKMPAKMIHEDATINVGVLCQKLEGYVAEGLAEKKGKKYIVDLSKLGYDKLLGGGKASFAIEVKAESASESAMEKIAAAGGSVELSGASEEEFVESEAVEEAAV